MKKKVLVIEDDRSLSLVLQREIEELGYDVYNALDGEAGLDKAASNSFSLIISDISLPKLNGFSVVEKLKSMGVKTPIIMMTNYNHEDNEIQSYIHGANIFHKKPLTFALLIAQIKMLVENYKFTPEITIGDITIDPNKSVFKKDDKPVKLSRKEFNLMLTLVSSPGEVFSRREIINKIRMNNVESEEGSVDTLVSRLRKKIGKFKDEEVIETVHGNGYRLNLLYLS